MSFDFEEIRTDGIKKVASKEVVVETLLPDTANAVKVLNASADVASKSVVREDNGAKVTGRINYKIAYLTAENEVEGLDYVADFSERVDFDASVGKLFCYITVVDVETEVNGGVRISAVLDIVLFGVCELKRSCLIGADDGCFVEKKQVVLQNFVCEVTGAATVIDEYETRADVEKIICCDADCYLTDFNAGLGNVLVAGGVRANVTYTANGEIYGAPFKILFTQELENDGFCMGQRFSGDCAVKSAKVIVTGVEGANVIKVEIEVEITVRAFGDTACEIVGGVFSVERDVSEKVEEIDCDRFKGTEFYSEKASGSVMLDGDMLPVRQVYGALSTKNTVTQSFVANGALTVEGVIGAAVIYSDDEGVNSIYVETPYSFKVDEVDNDDITVNMRGYVTDITARMKRDKEIEIFADVVFSCETNEPCKCSVVTEAADAGEKEIDDATISLYIADDGETMWNAAKALSACPDELRAQNPDLTEPLSSGDKVIYYRQINFEF